MLTLNTRQLRALSIVAPGTLLHTGHVRVPMGNQAPFFLPTADDSHRSGIWGIAAHDNGDVSFYREGVHRCSDSPGERVEYMTLIERDAEAQAEDALASLEA